jgi:two-component system cell cycle response regulator
MKNSGTVILSAPIRGSEKPKSQGEGCIILLHPPGPDIGRRTPLVKNVYVFGRDESVDLVISRGSVSRRHAMLMRDGFGNWAVQDMGSTNGTFVNEEQIERQMLEDGDQIRFGDAIFKFLVGGNVETAYHEEIYRMTIVDGLTGVHNKRYFLDFIDRELASAHRHGHPLSMVMMDIDHFKAVNDDRGHLAGDHVLKEMCGRIQPRIRREDLFARYGGEEFAAVLTVTPLIGALQFAESIRALLAQTPFTFAGEDFPVTVSLGVATVHNDASVESMELISRADANLYEAKHGGRNRVVPSLAEIQQQLSQ